MSLRKRKGCARVLGVRPPAVRSGDPLVPVTNPSERRRLGRSGVPNPVSSAPVRFRNPRRDSSPRSAPRLFSEHRDALTAGGETQAAFGRRSIPAKQPVMKPTRPSSPGGGSAGDPSRLNRVAARRSSLRFGRNTRGIPPSRALSAGPPPGGLAPPGELGLAALGAHPGSTTGCCVAGARYRWSLACLQAARLLPCLFRRPLQPSASGPSRATIPPAVL